MRKPIVALLIVALGASCFSTLICPALAQESTESATPKPLIIRWMRFRGAVTRWGNAPYHGIVIVNAKVANVPPVVLKPWASVHAVWSNEPRPIATDAKPLGEVTYTHYTARLVMLIAIRRQEAMLVNITGIWNVNKVTITSEFNANGVPVKVVRQVTPIVTRAKGQLHITDNWKAFNIEIEGIDTLKGVGLAMTTSTNMIHPFSFEASSNVTLRHLLQVVRCFRTMPGFGNYKPELDCNMDSKIDLADLTTAAANM